MLFKKQKEKIRYAVKQGAQKLIEIRFSAH